MNALIESRIDDHDANPITRSKSVSFAVHGVAEFQTLGNFNRA